MGDIILKAADRVLRDIEGKYDLGKYSSSRTELALEELCDSFGTELEPAYLETANRTLLVRLSRPLVVSSEKLGRQLLQFQYTKFSIFDIDQEYLKKVYEMFVASRKREKPVTSEEVHSYIHNQIFKDVGKNEGDELEDDKEKNLKKLARAVINNQAVKEMHLSRFEKKVYVAAFPAEKDEKRESFVIHEANSPRYSHKPATFFIRFNINPLFTQLPPSSDKENNTLFISWPAAKYESIGNLERAASVYGNLSTQHTSNFSEILKVSSDIPRESTMAFIRSFIRQSLDGTIF